MKKRERPRKWTRGKDTKRSGTMRAAVVRLIWNDVNIFIDVSVATYLKRLAERGGGIVTY